MLGDIDTISNLTNLNKIIKLYPNIKFIYKNKEVNYEFVKDFIKEFQDKVVWSSISERQKLSEDFLKKFQDKVVWFSLGTNNRISKEIKHSLKAQGFPIVFDYF